MTTHLKNELANRGMTQRELAKILKLTVQTIGSWCNLKKTPSFKHRTQLLAMLFSNEAACGSKEGVNKIKE